MISFCIYVCCVLHLVSGSDWSWSNSNAYLVTVDKAQLLKLHNDERQFTLDGLVHNSPTAAYNPYVTWSASLASDAAAEAMQCYYTHTGDNSDDGQGENLSMTTATNPSMDDVVSGWIEEKTGYTYGTISGTNTCTGFDSCKHYTQMVWAGSTQIGCALVKNCAITKLSTGTTFTSKFVCRYSAPGNVQGNYPYACKNGDCTFAGTTAPPTLPTSCFAVTSTVNIGLGGVYAPNGEIFLQQPVYYNSGVGKYLYYIGNKWAIGPSKNPYSFNVLCQDSGSLTAAQPSECSTYNVQYGVQVVTSTACSGSLNAEDESDNDSGSDKAPAGWTWLVLAIALIVFGLGVCMMMRAYMLNKVKVQVSVPDDEDVKEADEQAETLQDREIEIESELVETSA